MKKFICTILPALCLLAGSSVFSPLSAHESVIQNGQFQFMNPHAFATGEGHKNGAIFMGIMNDHPSEKANLIGGKTDIAESVEIHEMSMDGDTMKMRKIEQIELPPLEPVALEPHGLHIMLMGLKEPLDEGDTFTLYLTFDNSLIRKVEIPVVKPGTKLDVTGTQEHTHDDDGNAIYLNDENASSEAQSHDHSHDHEAEHEHDAEHEHSTPESEQSDDAHDHSHH